MNGHGRAIGHGMAVLILHSIKSCKTGWRERAARDGVAVLIFCPVTRNLHGLSAFVFSVWNVFGIVLGSLGQETNLSLIPLDVLLGPQG